MQILWKFKNIYERTLKIYVKNKIIGDDNIIIEELIEDEV